MPDVALNSVDTTPLVAEIGNSRLNRGFVTLVRSPTKRIVSKRIRTEIGFLNFAIVAELAEHLNTRSTWCGRW
jgi:hypothetical protein